MKCALHCFSTHLWDQNLHNKIFRLVMHYAPILNQIQYQHNRSPSLTAMDSPKLFMIRHAESALNLAMKLAMNTKSDVPNFADELLSVKFDPELIDCGLTAQGVEQCVQAAPSLANLEISLVLVSPLRRAIETAHLLFKDHPNQPKLLVLAQLREMISSTCDIGGRMEETMKLFPQFDYSQFLANENCKSAPNMWSLEYMVNQEQKKKAMHYVWRRIEDMNGNYNIDGPRIFGEYLSKFPADSVVEDFKDIRIRVDHLKQLLKEYLKDIELSQHLACVTHSRTLQTISASEFDQNNKPTNGRWQSNCEVTQLNL